MTSDILIAEILKPGLVGDSGIRKRSPALQERREQSKYGWNGCSGVCLCRAPKLGPGGLCPDGTPYL